MKVVLKNVMVGGRRSSMKLEATMWAALDEICEIEGVTRAALLTRLAERFPTNLTGATRVFIADYFRRAATTHGHLVAGHGSRDPLETWGPAAEPEDASGGLAAHAGRTATVAPCPAAG